MASPKQRTFTLSNFRRVRNTENRYDDMGTDTFAGLRNCYLPDPVGGGGAYQRPGTVAMTSVSSANDGQAVYCHTATDGTNYNFLFIGGKVYRQSTDLTSAPVDVTPLNVTISPTARIYVTSLADQIVVNDGVNLPWLGSDLGSTPITGTPIDYQTASVLLSIGSTDTQVANAAFTYLLSGTNYSKTATAAGTALPAGTIPMNTWGVYRVSVVAAGTITVTAGAANYTTGYASEALAIAALPALPASSWHVGYFTVLTEVGATFVAGTDALQGGASGNPSSDTNYYAGAAPPWTAFGQPAIYTGAVFFILSTVEGVSQRTTIAWSEPNQPNVGYQQTDYDNAWTLTQTNTEPLYALAPTNDALYYFRAFSIGAITGAPNINFQNTATHDVVSANVGCVSPAAVATFLNYVYFTDANGRPQRFAIGGAPEPIWLQAQQSFESGALTSAASSMWAVIEPNLNVYLVGPPPALAVAQTWFVFDAMTGIYFGIWQGGTGYLPVIGGVLQDASAIPQLVTLSGSSDSSVSVRKLARVQDAVWTDAGVQMVISWTTGFVGYNIGTTYTIPRIRAEISSIGTPVVTATFSTPSQVVTETAASSGGSFNRRFTWMTDTLVGRGVQVVITVTGGITQIKLYAISIEAVEQGDALIDDR